jgi:hypothetical protein
MNNEMMSGAELIMGAALMFVSPQLPDPGAGGAGGSIAPVVRAQPEVESTAARTASARLSLLRADGVELAWIEGLVKVPEFRGTRVLPDVLRFEAPWLDPSTGVTQGTGESIRFEVDRGTLLRDGGISGNAGMLEGDDGLMRLSSLASGEGEYDIYDLSLTWDAYKPGPLTLSVIGGIKAIDARIGRTVQSGGTTTFEDARGVVAVPVIGGGVAWKLSEDMTLSGMASTQTFDGAGSVVDLSAETSIRISPNIGFSAGYQFIRSAIEVQSMDAELEREGLFARLQIRF